MDFYAETESLQIRMRVQSSLLPLWRLTTSPTDKLHQRETCLLLVNLAAVAAAAAG